MIYERYLNLPKLLKNKSFFLFGARSTGKTTLIKAQLPKAKIYDLLDSEIFSTLLKRPKVIEEQLLDTHKVDQLKNQIIVIDEVQKLPTVLDEVHRLIEKYKVTFLLTGSSARKIKRGGVNLLAGRAWQAELFPLITAEINNFDLLAYLNTGGLPQSYNNSFAAEELRSYVSTYLREEVQAEALTRNLSAFASFIDAIALANAREINFDSLASDCGVSPMTLKNYIQILSDTMLGFSLPGFTKTKKRKAISRAKHYLFDIGITNQLYQRGEIKSESELFGNAYEHFIINEVRAWISYSRAYDNLTYWRSTSMFEVDLLIGQKVAIEIKATKLVQDKHLKGLRSLKEEQLIERYIIVSLDREKKTTEDGIVIYPWEMFLKDLWSGKIYR